MKNKITAALCGLTDGRRALLTAAVSVVLLGAAGKTFPPFGDFLGEWLRDLGRFLDSEFAAAANALDGKGR